MGQVVSWSALVESSIYLRGAFVALDPWITEGERLGAMLPSDLDPNFTGRFTACMLVSLLVRNPGHPHFSLWQRRCETLIPQCSDQQVLASLGFNLCFSYRWIGQARK